jgi:peptidoglycan/LPS O-acetylase OafA/YrhL
VSAPSLPLSEPRAAVDNHLLALTGLRIFPALLVYFSHFGAPAGSPQWLVLALASGYYGVTVFFVLSGFVLTINYWDRLTRPSARNLWSFAVARFARVYPLYLLVIAYMACRLHVLTGQIPPSWPWHLVGLQAWLPNIFDAFAFGPSWSISVEVFLYASLPLLLLGLRRLVTVRQLALAATITAVAMLALAAWFQHSGRAGLPTTDTGSAHHWLYRLPLTRLGDFLLGIFAARLYVSVRGRSHMALIGAIVAAAGVGAMLFLSTTSWMFNSAFAWDVGYALPAVLVILGLALSPGALLSRFFALRGMVLLGEASYAFYLIHSTFAQSFGAGSWTVRVTLGTLCVEAMSLGLVMAMALGLHVGIERPARVILRRLLDRRPPPARAPAALPVYYG